MRQIVDLDGKNELISPLNVVAGFTNWRMPLAETSENRQATSLVACTKLIAVWFGVWLANVILNSVRYVQTVILLTSQDDLIVQDS